MAEDNYVAAADLVAMGFHSSPRYDQDKNNNNKLNNTKKKPQESTML